MSSKDSDLVFSIDPGIVNIGVCCYNKKNKKIVYAGCEEIAKRAKDCRGEDKMLRKVHELFFGTSHLSNFLRNSCVVLIEVQMKRKMLLVQHAIAAVCIEKGYNYKFVSARVVKRHFGNGAEARKAAGKGINGTRANYSANKAEAIATASSIHPQFMGSLARGKKDDVSDAILQARWYADREDGTVIAVKKAPVKKAPAKKAPVKKAPAKKAPVKKAPAKKAPAKKTAGRRNLASKSIIQFPLKVVA